MVRSSMVAEWSDTETVVQMRSPSLTHPLSRLFALLQAVFDSVAEARFVAEFPDPNHNRYRKDEQDVAHQMICPKLFDTKTRMKSRDSPDLS